MADDQPRRNLPEFVVLDDKYLFTLCKRCLVVPVQAACGHRYCEECVKGYIEDLEENDTALCPDSYTDGPCDDITIDSVSLIVEIKWIIWEYKIIKFST